MSKPIVISISGISGSGKTTITKALEKKLDSCICVYFDDYDEMLHTDFFDWCNRGADANEYDLTPMIEDIKQAISKQPKYILLDYPFGYGNDQMSKFIDLAVYVDTPLDVAMARRILRDYLNRSPAQKPLRDPINQLKGELCFYLENSRNTYTQHYEVVKPHVDLVVDGYKNADENAEKILKAAAGHNNSR